MDDIRDIFKKKDFTFLLGAGASKEAGIPLTTELTKCIHDKLENNSNLQYMFSVIINGIKFGKTQKGSNPFEDVNVEEAISAIRLISERHHLEIAPFIYNWNPLIDQLDQKIDKFAQIKSQIDEVKKDIQHFKDTTERNFNEVKSLLTSKNSKSYLHFQKPRSIYSSNFRFPPNLKNGRFKDLLDRIQSTLKEIMNIDDIKRIEYISHLTKYANDNLVEVFTLNYDNTIELSCLEQATILQEGFRGNDYTNLWPEIEKGINLFKLHGSLSWQQDYEGNITKPLTQENFHSLPLLIIGNRDKLNHEGPFLDLLFEFSNRLNKYLNLIVTGYSFSDMHINRLLSKWLKENSRRKIIVANGPSFKMSEQVKLDESQLLNSLLTTSELYKLLSQVHKQNI